jgi:hypothetical protein
MAQRQHKVRKTLVALVVVVGLLVAADFGLAAVAEQKVATLLRTKLGVHEDPSVHINGFPFTTQALAGDYRDITIDAAHVPVKNALHDLQFHADLKGVHAPLSQLISGTAKHIPVDRLDGSVKINAADIGKRLHLDGLGMSPVPTSAVTGPGPISDAPPAAAERPGATAGVRLDTAINIAGQPTNITVLGLLSLQGGKLRVSAKKLSIANSLISGALPEPLQSSILDRFNFTFDPGSLPLKVVPKTVQVERGAVSVTGTARHFVLGT